MQWFAPLQAGQLSAYALAISVEPHTNIPSEELVQA